jgi:thioesterase domain-containing protein
MTPNGKVDRKALPKPGANSAAPIETAQGETETTLAASWCDLLRIDQVGRDDSFFDLGGHSLLVARLLVRIEQQWGRRIGMAEFFRSPQLRTLAARIDSEATTDLAEFVPLQPEGDGLPLLWIDGGLAFRPLAHAMGSDRPFLGLPLGPIIEPLLRPDLKFEEIATAVVAAIRKRQPRGPYLIGGWCTNGILAYEVARQLRAAGEDVPLLALGHSTNPVAFLRITTAQMRISKARYHLKAWSKLPLGKRLSYAIDRARGVLEEVGVAEPEVANAGYRIISAALEKAAYGYATGHYDGPVVLFQPAERLDVLDSRPGWSEVVTGPLDTHDVPGSHGTMVEPPNVAIFGALLRAAIDRALPAALAAAAE